MLCRKGREGGCAGRMPVRARGRRIWRDKLREYVCSVDQRSSREWKGENAERT